MNERIKELAVQAMDKHFPSFDNITARGQYSSSTYNRAIEEMMLMFAELIVRECVEIVEASKAGFSQVPAEVALDLTAKNIKAYFGLK